MFVVMEMVLGKRGTKGSLPLSRYGELARPLLKERENEKFEQAIIFKCNSPPTRSLTVNSLTFQL